MSLICAAIAKLDEVRKLFRLLKFLSEIKRIKMIRTLNKDKFSHITNIMSRVCYMIYYILDNLYILCHITNTNIPGIPREYLLRTGRVAWLVGLVVFLVYCIKTVRKTYTDESDLKVAALNKMTVKQMQDSLELIKKIRLDY